MNKISDFVVGKKYILKHVSGVFECVIVGKKQVVMKRDDGNYSCGAIPKEWEEYKEIVTVAKYAAVIRAISDACHPHNIGDIIINAYLHLTEDACRQNAKSYEQYWELIEIIPVTWTGEK